MMKKIYLTFLFVGLGIIAYAQAPKSFKYQAIARDKNGEIIANTDISIRIKILEGLITENNVYTEIHDVVTNNYGLITLDIGGGDLVSGSMESIDWGNNSYLLQVEIADVGDIGYQVLGKAQLVSVPYALYAEKAGNVFSGEYNDLLNKPDLSDMAEYIKNESDPLFSSSVAQGITAIDTTNWNNKLDTEIDGSVTNEIQDIALNGDTLSISGGSSVVLPAGGSVWQKTGDDIFYNNGKVNIGTTLNSKKFQIAENDNKLFFGDHPLSSGSWLTLYNSEFNVASSISIVIPKNDYIAFDTTLLKKDWACFYGNDLTQGFSFTPRILLGLDDGVFITNTGKMGIGTDNPDVRLNIEGNEDSGLQRNLLRVHNKAHHGTAYTGILLNTGNDTGSSVIQDYSTLYSASVGYDYGGFLNIGNSNRGIMFNANNNGTIKFYTANDLDGGAKERLRIDSAGNIGIGIDGPKAQMHLYRSSGHIEGATIFLQYDSILSSFKQNANGGQLQLYNPDSTSQALLSSYGNSYLNVDYGNVGIGTSLPKSKLHVKTGDIYIEDIGNGVIMKSPDGNCWRLTVANDGSIASTSVECAENKTDSIVLQPGPEGIDAAMQDYSSDINYGNDEGVFSFAWTFSSAPILSRALLQFDLSFLSENLEIKKAELYLYGIDHKFHGYSQSLSGPNYTLLCPVTSSWDEHTVTWNNQPAYDNTQAIVLDSCNTLTDYIIDVTDHVQNMISNPSFNYGWMMLLQTESYYRRMIFASSDHENVALRPKIVIYY